MTKKKCLDCKKEYVFEDEFDKEDATDEGVCFDCHADCYNMQPSGPNENAHMAHIEQEKGEFNNEEFLSKQL